MRTLFCLALSLAACANAPGNVTPACRGSYDACVNHCTQNPLNRASQSDGRGMPVHASEERAYNNDANASGCLSLCQSSGRQCTDERRNISAPASMPANR